jgi:hypothetical protein
MRPDPLASLGSILIGVRGSDASSSMSLLAADPAGGRLGLHLPGGRVVPDADGVPAVWLSDGAVQGDLLDELHADTGRTGLWPVVVNLEGFAQPVHPGWPPSGFDAETVLAGWSGRYARLAEHDYHRYGCEQCEVLIGVARDQPGASFADEADQDPGRTAAVVAKGQLDCAPYLGLVGCERSADIVTALGWDGPANLRDEIARYSAVLGRWEERYGARVVALCGATLMCSVARPPRSMEQALALTAEHLAFCPDSAGEFRSFDLHAAALIGTSFWSFWWD